MINNILLTVSITTFNMEKYIERAIESVLAQKTDFEYEIVVADDCSIDNTINILQQYQQRLGKKFRIIYAEKNRGLIANYVNSLEAAKGKYIASLDADDYWCDEYKIQKQIDILNQYPEIGYIHSNFYYEEEASCKRKIARSMQYHPSETNVYSNNLLNYDIYLGSSCIRKSVLDFDELNVFVNKNFCAQDYPVFLSLSVKTKGYYMSEPTAVCCFRKNSMSRQSDIQRRKEVIKKTFEISNYFAAKYPIPDSLEKLRNFRHEQTLLFTEWASGDFEAVKSSSNKLSLKQFLKYNPKATYIFIASKNKFLYKIIRPWFLRKRKLGN